MLALSFNCPLSWGCYLISFSESYGDRCPGTFWKFLYFFCCGASWEVLEFYDFGVIVLDCPEIDYIKNKKIKASFQSS